MRVKINRINVNSGDDVVTVALQVGMWIGVALGLLVVLGLLVLGVYFYMKQRALQSTKPPPYSRDRED